MRHLIVDPAVALREQFATLVVGWRWPSLTQGLIAELHDQGRTVLGVCDVLDEGSRDILVRCGVDRIVTSDAPHHEFIEALILMQREFDPDLVTRPRRSAVQPSMHRESIIAVSGPAGAGSTEIAIELGRVMGGVVVDCDEVAPTMAPRLALALEPNIRSLVDAVEHGIGEVADAIVAASCGAVDVVAGIPNVAGWSQVRGVEVMRALRALAQRAMVIADTASLLEEVGSTSRGRFAATRAVLHEAEAIVAVGLGNPFGVVRLIAWITELQCLRPGAPIVVVLNRAPSNRLRCADLADEVARVLGDIPVLCVPFDAKVDAAVWAGTVLRRGAFSRAVGGVVDAVTDLAEANRRQHCREVESSEAVTATTDKVQR